MEGLERLTLPVPRRDFMKLLGLSLGSMLLARCQRSGAPEPTNLMTCYQPTAVPRPTEMLSPESATILERLRLCWLCFDELEQKTRDGAADGTGEENPFGIQLTADHRSALDELVAAGAIDAAVADLVHEAYTAAVWHVWRSNALITCYDMAMPDFTPDSAADLVRQAEILGQVAAGGTIAPETLAKAQDALQHDFAYCALTDEDVQALYTRQLEEYNSSGESVPSFEELELMLTPDARAAARFLIDLWTGDGK